MATRGRRRDRAPGPGAGAPGEQHPLPPGAALYKAGDKAGARKELQPLAAGDMAFAQADETRALLRQLQ